MSNNDSNMWSWVRSNRVSRETAEVRLVLNELKGRCLLCQDLCVSSSFGSRTWGKFIAHLDVSTTHPSQVGWIQDLDLHAGHCRFNYLSLEHGVVYKEIQATPLGEADTVPLQNSHQQMRQELNLGQRSIRIWSEPRKRGLDLNITHL